MHILVTGGVGMASHPHLRRHGERQLAVAVV
jgi:hypothetical protein